MEKYLNKPERKLLFELLRLSLNGEMNEFSFEEQLTDTLWSKCYTLSCEQGVMALAFDGAMLLPSDLQPPKNIKIQWGMNVQNYIEKYNYYCNVAGELYAFYKKNGIAAVQLKGVGLSLNYNNPSSRQGGDIDIYTYSETDSLTDKQANTKADTLMQDMGIEVDSSGYKHSNFYYKNIPIENHKNFLNVEHYSLAKKYNSVLLKYLKPQESILNEKGAKILTPSVEFNCLFITFHAAQHLTSGIKLHHIYDWAVLLKKYGNRIPQEVNDSSFLEWVDVLTHICNSYLGTDAPYSGSLNKKLYDLTLKEIFTPYSETVRPPGNPVGIFIYKLKRFFRNNKITGDILGNTIYRAFWFSLVAHLKRPSTILLIDKK